MTPDNANPRAAVRRQRERLEFAEVVLDYAEEQGLHVDVRLWADSFKVFCWSIRTFELISKRFGNHESFHSYDGPIETVISDTLGPLLLAFVPLYPEDLSVTEQDKRRGLEAAARNVNVRARMTICDWLAGQYGGTWHVLHASSYNGRVITLRWDTGAATYEDHVEVADATIMRAFSAPDVIQAELRALGDRMNRGESGMLVAVEGGLSFPRLQRQGMIRRSGGRTT